MQPIWLMVVPCKYLLSRYLMCGSQVRWKHMPVLQARFMEPLLGHGRHEPPLTAGHEPSPRCHISHTILCHYTLYTLEPSPW
jgi:hypothetical protein